VDLYFHSPIHLQNVVLRERKKAQEQIYIYNVSQRLQEVSSQLYEAENSKNNSFYSLMFP